MIEARGLVKHYRSTLAVDNLSFGVRPGTVTGFLGPNGAGKSTTMRMIMGLDRPDAGQVRIGGKSYGDLPPSEHWTTTQWYRIVVLSATQYRENRRGPAMDDLTEMLKGTLEGCVLEIIGGEETYGYAITRRLNDLGFADVVEGTVYTILLRLEKNGLVQVTKRPSGMGPPRKFYALNDTGRGELGRFWAKWEYLSSRIEKLREGGR